MHSERQASVATSVALKVGRVVLSLAILVNLAPLVVLATLPGAFPEDAGFITFGNLITLKDSLVWLAAIIIVLVTSFSAKAKGAPSFWVAASWALCLASCASPVLSIVMGRGLAVATTVAGG
jgi:hypothetical protein